MNKQNFIVGILILFICLAKTFSQENELKQLKDLFSIPYKGIPYSAEIEEKYLRERYDAIIRLEAIAAKNEEAVYILIQTLYHDSSIISACAHGALVRMGKKTVCYMIKALENEQNIQRKLLILDVLRDLGSLAYRSIPIIIKELENAINYLPPNDEYPLICSHRLVKEQVAFLKQKYPLAEEYIFLTCRIMNTLVGIGKDSQSAIPILMKVLKNKKSHLRWNAMDTIAHICPPAEIIPELLEFVNDEDLIVQSTTVEALGNIGQDAIMVVPILCNKFKNTSDSTTRQIIIRNLVKIDIECQTIIPFLLQCLDDNNDLIKEKAIKYLGNAGNKAEIALPKLYQLLKDEKSYVRESAQEAIRKISK